MKKSAAYLATAVVLLTAWAIVLRHLSNEHVVVPEPSGARETSGLADLAVGTGASTPMHDSILGATSEPARESLAKPAPVAVLPDVTGIVVDEQDRPVPDVTVEARRAPKDNPTLARSDAQGRFELGNLDAGFWFFAVDDARFAKTWWREHGILVPQRVEERVSIRLHQPRTVEGVVVDEAGEPVADAVVRVAIERLEAGSTPVQGHLTETVQETRSDASGGFTFTRLRPGEMRVVLDHAGFARTLASFDAPSDDVRLVISKGIALEGVVVSAGRRLAGVKLRAHAPHRAKLSMGSFETTTDDAGRFRIEGIHSFYDSATYGMWTVSVSLDDPEWASDVYHVFETAPSVLPQLHVDGIPKKDAPAEPKVTDVARDRAREVVTAVGPTGTARIRVDVDAPEGAREHVVGALVQCSGISDPLRNVRRNARLDPDLRATFEKLPGGDYRVSFEAEDASLCRLPGIVHVEEGAEAEVSLHGGPASLVGQVLSAGEPAAGMRIRCRPINFGHDALVAGAGSVSDEDGRYAIDGLAPSRYVVAVTFENSESPAMRVELEVEEPVTTYDLELPIGRIDGVLRGVELARPGTVPRDRRRPFAKPPGRIRVVLRDSTPTADDPGVAVEPDADGAFHVRYLPFGDYTISLHDEKGRVHRRAVTLDARVPRRDVVFEKPEASGAIAGSVSLSKPPSDRMNVEVDAYPCDERGADATVGYPGRIDPSTGAFRVERLPPGRYALMLRSGPNGTWLWIPGLAVEGSETIELGALSIPEGRRVTFQFDPDPQTMQVAWRLRTPLGESLPSKLFTDRSPFGSARANLHLPYGEFVVEADVRGGPAVRQTVRVEPGRTPMHVVVRTR